jgi:CRISPR-associated protein Cas2
VTVLIAHDTPPAIRGILKRWFIEPKPNVFIATLNRRTRHKVIQYVIRNAPAMSLLIIHSDNSCQGYQIERHGEPDRQDIELSGLWLIAEKWAPDETTPF